MTLDFVRVCRAKEGPAPRPKRQLKIWDLRKLSPPGRIA
jgi:hypothetical protein